MKGIWDLIMLQQNFMSCYFIVLALQILCHPSFSSVSLQLLHHHLRERKRKKKNDEEKGISSNPNQPTVAKGGSFSSNKVKEMWGICK